MKGADVPWNQLEFGTKERRGISIEKMRDLMKQIPLLHSAEARSFILDLIDLPNHEMIDELDSVDDLEGIELEHNNAES